MIETILDELQARANPKGGTVEKCLEATKEPMRNLRSSFGGSNPTADYQDPHVRAAYMLGYYPKYTLPVYKLLVRATSMLNTWPSNKNKVTVMAQGSGPAPEVIGLVKYLCFLGREDMPIDAYLMDVNSEYWSLCTDISLNSVAKSIGHQGKITYTLNECNLLDECGDCDSNDTCEPLIGQCDIVVIQNALKDIKPNSRFFRHLDFIWSSLNPGALLILADLKYEDILATMESIASRFKDSAQTLVSPSLSEPLLDYGYPQVVLEHLFDNSDGLKAPKRLKYYGMVLRKM